MDWNRLYTTSAVRTMQSLCCAAGTRQLEHRPATATLRLAFKRPQFLGTLSFIREFYDPKSRLVRTHLSLAPASDACAR